MTSQLIKKFTYFALFLTLGATANLAISLDMEQLERSSVYFARLATDLDAKAQKHLDDIASLYNSSKSIKTIELTGHTDGVGSYQENWQLGQDRAERVSKYLISKGIDAMNIKLKSVASTLPKGANKTEEGRALNRRVDITLQQ